MPADQSMHPLDEPRFGLWARRIRIWAALSALGILAFYFVPAVYTPTLFQCATFIPSWGYAFNCPSPSSGLMSLSYALFHWGSTYSLASWLSFGAYNVLPVGFFALPDGGKLTTFGSLFLIALPVAMVGLGLLGPEITGRMRLGRAGFTFLGAGFVSLSAAMFASMAMETGTSGLPPPPDVALGTFLGFGGLVIVLYGIGFFDSPPQYPSVT
ncbi:MAG: hypothetical protein JRN44_01235 [Nitrososphaerota archaeon]|nr:hypothetical protein [Nitrososphaerota archaeon]MDG6941698.1 hypothetical protein [Nitrososphaerota archaeon]MDG6947129.1 hypothetical protein [Nitrososphaerota archaeon]MDG6951481.1 hypothetical protein [Nitrososphaerota archaeon]